MAEEMIQQVEAKQEAPIEKEEASQEVEAKEPAEEKAEGPSTEELIELEKRLQALHDRKAELEKELNDVHAEIEYMTRTNAYQKGEEWVAEGNARLAELAGRELEALKSFKKLVDETAAAKSAAEGEARAARARNGEIIL